MTEDIIYCEKVIDWLRDKATFTSNEEFILFLNADTAFLKLKILFLEKQLTAAKGA
jgi:hypothetical protein